ncbi:MAG TPA: 50S ribosomal protein L23 [Polyangiaceae bacterium]|jgi:large subunit ribosomal protein L23|nr:50S ribosomal protein L23 [Polyangiaceae bacterium]
MKPTDIIKRPVALTEKATRLKEANKVIFEVALGANKLEIKSAVEALFNVKVADVNTIVQRGKMKRMGRGLAKRPNFKKAVVTLREGNDIQFFDESKE